IRNMARDDFKGDSNIWKPERPNEVLAGSIRELKYSTGKFGKQLVVVVETEDGDVIVYTNKTTAGQITKQKARVGDEIAIRYFGKEQTFNGNTTKVYGVLVKQADAEIDEDVQF